MFSKGRERESIVKEMLRRYREESLCVASPQLSMLMRISFIGGVKDTVVSIKAILRIIEGEEEYDIENLHLALDRMLRETKRELNNLEDEVEGMSWQS